MEILKHFKKKPNDYVIRTGELTNRHELNIKRAREFMHRNVNDSVSLETFRDAEAIFMATGATLADVAWIAGMNKYGLSRQEILDIWTAKQNKADELRERLHKD